MKLLKNEQLNNFADIEYLRSLLPCTCENAFFEYLLNLDTKDVVVYAIDEGSVVFPKVPLLRIEGPLAVVQLLETTLLNLVNYARQVYLFIQINELKGKPYALPLAQVSEKHRKHSENMNLTGKSQKRLHKIKWNKGKWEQWNISLMVESQRIKSSGR